MRTVRVEFVGETPILMHADNIEWADQMAEWQKDPKNKGKSKAGDDRTPAWRWIGCLNYDDPQKGVVTIPYEYTMSCLMGGAAEVPMGKGQKTFKSLSQSGIMCSDLHWPLLINGGTPVQMKPIHELLKVSDFKKHKEAVKEMGFELYTKRAKVGQSKHIRVRPRFDNWRVQGDLIIIDDLITNAVLENILDAAGRLKGLCDWRPGGKTPGPWGRFKARILS